jgi:predicted MPP superfamily phosphohydrolase
MERRSRHWRAGYGAPIGRTTNLKLAGAGAAGAVAGLAWWALWHEPRSTALRREALALPHWPRALDGLAVAVIADLHTGSPHVGLARLERIVDRIDDERPDLVVLLGDYADRDVALGDLVEPEQVAARLARLDAPLGRFAVLGNHDWHEYGGRMARALRDEGITVLENHAVRLTGAAAPFWVAGVADASTRDPRLDPTLAPVPDGEPVLLLSHDPDVFPAVPERVALTLSGHTHGAQVDLPIVRDRFTPSQHGARYTDGHHVEDGRHLYVSNGVGTSRLPIRFRARPEVALLRLEAA